MRMNQQQRVWAWLKQYGTLAPLQAWRRLGVWRLSDVILKLRRNPLEPGYHIGGETITVINAWEEEIKFLRYKLERLDKLAPRDLIKGMDEQWPTLQS